MNLEKKVKKLMEEGYKDSEKDEENRADHGLLPRPESLELELATQQVEHLLALLVGHAAAPPPSATAPPTGARPGRRLFGRLSRRRVRPPFGFGLAGVRRCHRGFLGGRRPSTAARPSSSAGLSRWGPIRGLVPIGVQREPPGNRGARVIVEVRHPRLCLRPPGQ